ncbi:hypothetical protein [Acidithiobacillus thiooxidans]|jgi:hypothetical protein|uniref:hypothetical protein n=1 Tax=Acidithiobacillus thiooxidans TaxID=930 RepID=UPI001C0740BE|nr:hypothetical protein [Acidithiobacillus thiooxidans]
MASDIWNIVLNIIAAFIYAGIVWLWKNRGTPPQPSPLPSAPVAPENVAPVDRRIQNRQTFEVAANRFIFLLVTFTVLYLSITMPPLFKALFAKEPVLLSHARFIGEYPPAIAIGKDYLQLSFFLVATLLYWPLLLLAENITSLLYPLIDWFRPVTFRI